MPGRSILSSFVQQWTVAHMASAFFALTTTEFSLTFQSASQLTRFQMLHKILHKNGLKISAGKLSSILIFKSNALRKSQTTIATVSYLIRSCICASFFSIIWVVITSTKFCVCCRSSRTEIETHYPLFVAAVPHFTNDSKIGNFDFYIIIIAYFSRHAIFHLCSIVNCYNNAIK